MVRLSQSFSFSLLPKAPYSFELTIRKPARWDLFTPFEIYENETLWTALHIEEKLVGLRLSSGGKTDSPKVLATAFSADRVGQRDKQHIKSVLAEKLSAKEDLSEFYRFAQNVPTLRHCVEDLYGMHDTLAGSVFDLAVLAICLQMAPLKRSEQMMHCLVSIPPSIILLTKFRRQVVGRVTVT
jgi:hypothetical protein